MAVKKLKKTGPATRSVLDKVSAVTSSRAILAVCLILIAAFAFLIRIQPMRWGIFLSEFDPFWHYYVAQHIVDHGFNSVFGWIDYHTWYPWGRDVAATTPLGLPYTAAVLFIFLRTISVQISLLDLTIFLPPVMAAVTSVIIYFLGREIAGKEVGLLAALFLAFNNAYISRTSLGFFKHETVGVFAIVLASFFFLRAVDLKRPTHVNLIYATLAGLTLAYLNISWGAFYFMFGLIPLYAFVMVVARKYSDRLLAAYFITMAISILLALPFPRPGLGVLTTAGALPAIAGFIILASYGLLSRLRTLKLRPLPVVVCIVVAAVVVGVLYQSGLTTPLAEKFVTVLNPSLRAISPAGPIIESVAEHRVSTWASFYFQFGSILFFVLLGFFFAFKRRHFSDIYLILFAVAALYFGASFIRLNLILAPAFCLLAAYGLIGLVKPIIKAAKGFRVRVYERVAPSVNPRMALAFTVILIVILTPTLYDSVNSAYSPVTIASASTPLKEYRSDWLDALSWIDQNIPKDKAVVCWWDYGYWVAVGSNSTSVADNATLNTTQIAKIGQVLLSDERTAFNLTRRYFKTDYILVFLTTANSTAGYHLPWGFGDEGKWIWMAAIAHDFHPEISRETVDMNGDGFPDSNTLLGKLILYSLGIPVEFEDGEVVYASPSHYQMDSLEITTQVIIIKGKG